jgi:hypothetical protein
MTRQDELRKMPKRIWVEFGASGPDALVWVGGSKIGLRKLPEYALATELADALEREAKLREALIATMPSHKNPASLCWCPAHHYPGYGHTVVCNRNRAALGAMP